MPIPLDCDCGRSFRIKEELAGKRVRCPECQTILTVPDPAKGEVAEEELLDVLMDDTPKDEETPPRSSVSDEPAAEERHEWEPPQRRPPPPPRKRGPILIPREKERRAPRVAFKEGWFGSVNSGVVGGLLMMLIAGVLFVTCLGFGRIWFWPAILFVIGFIAFIKGLAGGGD